MNKVKQFLKRKFPILIRVKYFLRSIIMRNRLEFLELHIVDTCNLNCKGCTSFSNISQYANFVDARLLGIRLQKISNLFTIERIRILGGEPLLHPDIVNILKTVRQAFPYSNIELVTNGILLTKMADDFFETCRHNKITIYVSSYPVLKNKSELVKTFSSFSVNYEFSPMIFTFTANLNPEGNSDKEATFKNCRYAPYRTIKNDNIYICPICAYIDKYNEYFNKKIPVGKGINIYTNLRKQIFDYLRNPEETCRYCTNVTRYMDWQHSTKPEESDWYGEMKDDN